MPNPMAISTVYDIYTNLLVGTSPDFPIWAHEAISLGKHTQKELPNVPVAEQTQTVIACSRSRVHLKLAEQVKSRGSTSTPARPSCAS